jgi:hypothetical protein
MQLDLVHRRHRPAAGDQILNELGARVADADRPDPPIGEQPLGCLPRRHSVLPVRRHRLVQKPEVELFEPELARGAVEAVQRLV